MFSKQPGNTELEKWFNFISKSNIKFTQWNVTTTDNQDIICMVVSKGVEVFNSLGEKVGEFEIEFKPKTVQDLWEYLGDLGFNI